MKRHDLLGGHNCRAIPNKKNVNLGDPASGEGIIEESKTVLGQYWPLSERKSKFYGLVPWQTLTRLAEGVREKLEQLVSELLLCNILYKNITLGVGFDELSVLSNFKLSQKVFYISKMNHDRVG